jgi:sulfur-carrier protein
VIRIQAFGQLTDIVGEHAIEINHFDTIELLQQELYNRYPALQSKKYVFALDNTIVQVEQSIKDGDTISLFPPFSGG